MEIGEVDFETDRREAIESKPRDWEKVGGVALMGFSLVAVSALVPALVKKKKVYLPSTSSISVAVEVADTFQGEKPSPLPICMLEEQKKVEEIFTTTAEKGTGFGLGLIPARTRLIKLGKEIDHIHPFSFLLAAPKSCVKKIFHEGISLAKSKVMGGIIKGMEREFAKKNLECYIPSFAEKMGKNSEQIRHWIRARNWKELVRYLFDIHANAEW